MSDLDRYLTDDMIHVALRASDSANEGGVVGGRERMMRAALSAILPVIIRQAQTEALESLLGQLPEPARPYAGSPFFWEGYMRAVKEEAWEEALQAALPDIIQQTKAEAWDALSGIIRQAKAEAWDEGAHTAWERSTPEVNGARYHWRHDGEPVNPYENGGQQ